MTPCPTQPLWLPLIIPIGVNKTFYEPLLGPSTSSKAISFSNVDKLTTINSMRQDLPFMMSTINVDTTNNTNIPHGKLLDLEPTGTTKYPTPTTSNSQGSLGSPLKRDIYFAIYYTDPTSSLLNYAKEASQLSLPQNPSPKLRIQLNHESKLLSNHPTVDLSVPCAWSSSQLDPNCTFEPESCIVGRNGFAGTILSDKCTNGGKRGDVNHPHPRVASPSSIKRDTEGDGSLQWPCMDIDGDASTDELHGTDTVVLSHPNLGDANHQLPATTTPNDGAYLSSSYQNS